MKLISAVAVLVLVSAIPNPASEGAGDNTPKGTPAKNSKSEERDPSAQSTKPVARPDRTEGTSYGYYETEKARNPPTGWPEPVTAASTALIAILALVTAIYVRRQTGIFRQQISALTEQTVAMGKQVEITEKTFLATFRPRLAVHQFSVWGDLFISGVHGVGKNASIEFVLVNIGDATATLGDTDAVTGYFLQGLPSVRGMRKGVPLMNMSGKSTLAPGERAVMRHELDNERDRLGNSARKDASGNAEPMYFIGRIEYTDGSGLTRQIGFCRKFNPISEARFETENDPDYQYEDRPN